MAKYIQSNSFFHTRLQAFVASCLFPAGTGDWYKNKGYGPKDENAKYTAAFDDFISKQKNDENAHYYKAFKGLEFGMSDVKSKLTDGKPCTLEMLECKPEADAPQKPGTGKHIVYFPGANTYYQGCFRDITAAARETGATVHAFNFPGTGRSTGKVREANDLTNAGIAVVRSLLKQGIKPDDIILQGDCYGAGIALEVKKQLDEQAGIKVRVIMNNAFKSFKAIVIDMVTQTSWLPNTLNNIIKRLLEFTGWHITTGKTYKHADPYQCHIQHLGDQTLATSTLSDKVGRYQHEIKTQTTKSQKREPITDSCPEEYKADRDELDKKHYVRVKEEDKDHLGKKFGRDQFGRVNAHFADLCELEMLNGDSVYEGYVNDYLTRSDKYINNHPQTEVDLSKIHFLPKAEQIKITHEEASDMLEVADLIQEQFSFDFEEDEQDNFNYRP